MTTETISAHQWVLNYLQAQEASGQHAPVDTMRAIMAEHERMQNAINFAARSSSARLAGLIDTYNIGAVIGELKALDNGAPIKPPLIAGMDQGGKTFTQQDAINIAATTANMFDGLEISGDRTAWDSVTELWHGGFLELTMYLGEFAIISERMLKERNPQDFPGVYDYEVAYPFGKWFREHLTETCKAPTLDEGTAKLKELADAFFKQGEQA